MFSFISIVLLFLAHSGIAQQQDSLPVQLPQVDIEGRNDGTCPSAEVTEQARHSTKEEIRSILRDTVVPILDRTSIHGRCSCGGPGQWRRIAHLNMSDPNQQCPSNWRLITTPVRGCGRTNNNICNSAVFPSHGSSYSRVCGRINAVQKGSTNAFEPSIEGRNPGLEGVYIDGVSLTHGPAGSRQHVWTFAAALYETDPNYDLRYVCQCINMNYNWPYQIPSFIGNNYFCDTSNPGPSWSNPAVYQDDPLWDGEGCGPTSTCCQLNNPPWFCTTLPQPTTDDIELRICSTHGIDNEDVYVQLVDIFVM